MTAVLDRPAPSADRPPPDWWPDDLPNPRTLSREGAVQALFDAGELTAMEFHLLYDRTPPGFKAELIEGKVYVASPVSGGHSGPHLNFTFPINLFRAETHGVAGGIDQTATLEGAGEAQPDLFLRVRLDHGGRVGTWNLVDDQRVPAGDDGDFLDAGPEFVLEVARSTLRRDLGAKRRDYARGGVREYVVADVRAERLVWYDLADDPATARDLPADGVLRSSAMPGLWLDGAALFAGDLAAVRAASDAGLASPEHAAFAAKLAAARDARAAAAGDA